MKDCKNCRYGGLDDSDICKNNDSILYSERIGSIIDGCRSWTDVNPTDEEIAESLVMAPEVLAIDNVKAAYDVLRGYCLKHIECKGCRFGDGDSVYSCKLIKSPPCDWREEVIENGKA